MRHGNKDFEFILLITDLKDGKEVPYEELKMACLVQSSLLFFYQQDTKHLLKGGIGADCVKQSNYRDDKTSSKELGMPSWYWTGIKMDPLEYLGPKWIPGTEEWKKMHDVHEKIYEKVMGNRESQK